GATTEVISQLIEPIETIAPVIEPPPLPPVISEPQPAIEEHPVHELNEINTIVQPTARIETAEPIRPLTPSVPTRIAAPSIRAMPPRPPKTHRHLHTADRPVAKKDVKPKAPEAETAVVDELPKTVNLVQALTVQELAEKMNVPLEEII